MTLKLQRFFLAVTLVNLGCATVKRVSPELLPTAAVDIQPKPTDYSVEILLLDVNLLSRKLLFSNASGNLARVLQDPDTVVTRCPVLYVSPGEKTVRDERKVYRYPVEFDAEGRPLQFQTCSVGTCLEAELTKEPAGSFTVRVVVEDASLKELEPIRAPDKTVYERPVVHMRRAAGSAPAVLGEWAVVSRDAVVVMKKTPKGMIRDQVWRVILVKLQPPKS